MQNESSIFDEFFQEKDQMTLKQQKIVEAAIETFAEKGYAASSTSEIAKKAGVAEGTIFRHYKTKKDLLLSIIAPTMAKFITPFFIKELNQILDSPYDRYEEFLRVFIKNRQEFIHDHLASIKILLQEIPFHEDLKKHFMDQVASNVYNRFALLIQRYQENGQLIEIPPARAFRFTASTILGLLLSRYILLPEADWSDEEEIEATIHFIMNGIGIRPPSL